MYIANPDSSPKASLVVCALLRDAQVTYSPLNLQGLWPSSPVHVQARQAK